MRQFPALDILSQLTLLNLRDNELVRLADALPPEAVQSLRVLDISGNPLVEMLSCAVTAANLAAFSGNWASLRVVGIRPGTTRHASWTAQPRR